MQTLSLPTETTKPIKTDMNGKHLFLNIEMQKWNKWMYVSFLICAYDMS